MITGGSEENQHCAVVQIFLAFGQAVKETDCAVAKVVIEVFFKAFKEENTSFLCFLISFVSENIRTSNDRESIC